MSGSVVARRVHRIRDDEIVKPASVNRQELLELWLEYRKLVEEFKTCCMSGERYLLAKAVVDRYRDRLGVEA